MTDPASDAIAVVIERELPFSPESVWQALTRPSLIEEWLMKNDFEPVVGHRFELRAAWGTVECRVLKVEPLETLAYSWVAFGVETLVTWSLAQSADGTRLSVEQSGFRAGQQKAYEGARYGWQQFLTALEQVLARNG